MSKALSAGSAGKAGDGSLPALCAGSLEAACKQAMQGNRADAGGRRPDSADRAIGGVSPGSAGKVTVHSGGNIGIRPPCSATA